MSVLTEFALTAPGTEDRLRVEGAELVGNGHSFNKLDDEIWDLTRHDRRDTLDKFAAEYSAVRAAEHREVAADEVCVLPQTRPDHPLAAMWSERAASHERFESAIAEIQPAMAIDVGAGCGWLASRLSAAGWRAAAIDITVAGGDGLASAVHHGSDLLLVRAEMEALPFASNSVDLAVLNASLHYAADVRAAIAEAIRVLREGATLVVLDSPVYIDPQAGRAMVGEFAEYVLRTHGIPAATHAGPGFVLEADLEGFGFDRVGSPGALRERLHRWRGARRAGRETATRPLLVAKIGALK